MMWPLLSLIWIFFVTRIDGAISNASVVPASLSAGVTGDADVSFIPGLDVPVGGRLVVVFPPTFYVAATLFRAGASGFDTSSPLSMGSNSYTVVVTVAGAPITAGTTVSYTVDGVTNPGEGTTTSYTIRTSDANGNTLESTSSIGGSSILRTDLSAASLSSSSPHAGAAIELTVKLTTSRLLRIGSVIELQFPTQAGSAFLISGASIISRVGIHTSSSVSSAAIPHLRILVAGQDVAANTDIEVVLGGIYNPAAQALGTFSLRTRYATGAIVQDKTGLAIADIQSTTLASSASVRPSTYFGGAVTSYVVTFANAALFSTGSKVTITFPSRFQITAATLLSTNNLPSSGTTLTIQSATQLCVTIGTGTISAGSNRAITLGNIVNPGSSCDQYIYEYCSPTWEEYGIALTDSADNVYESSTSVPGTPILKKPMVFARVRPVLKKPLTTTSMVVSFTSETTIPVGGRIDVMFPAGFIVDPGVTVLSRVGFPAATTMTVSASGQQVALAIAGVAIPPTSQLSITYSSAITTPVSSAVGMYIIRTRDSQGKIMEEHDKINGEGCLYLNSCSGHGFCSLFSSTCICDAGWGAGTDIASYRAPDCSQRTCPSARSWTSLPTDESNGHNEVVECSAMGVCDRSTGKCVCFAGFEGSACQRMTCPSNCRGHGRCVSMKELAAAKNGFPLSAPTTYTGLKSTTTWDEDMVFGCACDSSWAVGTGNGELQVTEYFGGDCSRRHCPTGDDPETIADDTNCNGVAVPGSTGAAGNLCHVECSNRGICNFKSGICQCFFGYSGYACQDKD